MGDKSAGEGRPPPSPLTGGYLLIVLPQAHLPQHKDNVLHNLTKGLITWDKEDCHVDLEKELDTITSQAPEGEEAKNGERLIQFASENLVTEVLIHPQLNTLTQCLRNLLSSFTRHRHIIHAGYTCAGNGAWMLQDGTYSFADFSGMYQEIEVQRVLRAYENTVTVDVHCCQEGDWNNLKAKDPFSKVSRVRLNPNDKLSASKSIHGFVDYLKEYVVSECLDELLESSEVVGNIRFSHPTLYVFPGGQGDAALFGINGFNMLVDGGFARKACFWDFTRHLDRLDAILMTRINNGNVLGLSSLLQRKKIEHVYPQIGHFFCNIQEKKHLLSPDGDKDKDPLLINLIDYGHEMISNLKHIQLKPQSCFRESSLDPINLYHKVGHGKLDMYVLSPSKDSREVRDFMVKWNTMDSKIFCSYNRRGGEFNFPLCNKTSICALLVWQPANPEDNITRILFPGSTPQNKIFEGLDRLKNLEFMKHAVCSAKTLSPSPSSVGLNLRSASRKTPLIEKVEEVKKAEAVKPVKSLEKVQKQPVKPSKPKTEKPKPKTEVETKPETVKNETIKQTEAVQKLEKKEKPKKLAPKPEKKAAEKKVEKKEVKSSPTTPKKVVENKDEKPAKSRSSTRTRASPSATPAKSAKEANNRKVLEQKTKETSRPQKIKKEEKKPEKTLKKPPSPTKKSPVKVQKPPAVKRPEKKEVPNDSAVTTPLAVKDILETVPTAEEKPLSREDEEDILIVEKVEIEIPEVKEEDAKKGDLLDVQQSVDSKSPNEIRTESQETSAGINNLPSEKITPKDKEVKERSNEIIEQKLQEESQPDEKFSTTVESGQTTTAPTLPEDERIPPDEVKEPEEKHVEKEKEKPKLDQPSLPEVPVIPITFDQRAQLLKDIVKTPDEVADLPVHEEADGGFYEGKRAESREDLLEIPKQTKNVEAEELKFIKDGFEKEDKSKDLKEDFDPPEAATESIASKDVEDQKKISDALKSEEVDEIAAETKLPKDILKYEATLLDDDAFDEEKDKETEKESLDKVLTEEKYVFDSKEKEHDETKETVINEAVVEKAEAQGAIKEDVVEKHEVIESPVEKVAEVIKETVVEKTAEEIKEDLIKEAEVEKAAEEIKEDIAIKEAVVEKTVEDVAIKEAVVEKAAEDIVINEAVVDKVSENVIKQTATVIESKPAVIKAEEPKKEEKSIFGFISKTASDLKDKISEKFSEKSSETKISKEAEEWASTTDKIKTELHVVERLKEEGEIKLAVESQIQEENAEVETDIETEAIAHEIIEPELDHVKEETEVPIYDDIPKDIEEILRKGSILKEEDVTLPDKEVYEIMQTKDGIISEIDATVIKESLPGTIIEPPKVEWSDKPSPNLITKTPSPDLRLNGEDKAKIDGENVHAKDDRFDISADSPADIYKRDSLISQVDTKSETSREVSPIPAEGKIDHEKFEDKEILKKELESSRASPSENLEKKIETGAEALPLPPRDGKEPEKPDEKLKEKPEPDEATGEEKKSAETLTAKQELGKVSPALEGIAEEIESKTSTPEQTIEVSKHESPIPSKSHIPSPEPKTPIPSEHKSSPSPATEKATPQKSPSPHLDQKLPQEDSSKDKKAPEDSVHSTPEPAEKDTEGQKEAEKSPSPKVEEGEKAPCKLDDMKDVLSSKSPSPKLQEMRDSKSPSPEPRKIDESQISSHKSEISVSEKLVSSKSPSPTPEKAEQKSKSPVLEKTEKPDGKPLLEEKAEEPIEEEKASLDSAEIKLDEQKSDDKSELPMTDKLEEQQETSSALDQKSIVDSKSPSPTTEKFDEQKVSLDAKCPSPDQKPEELKASDAKSSSPVLQEKLEAAKSPSLTAEKANAQKSALSKSPSPAPEIASDTKLLSAAETLEETKSTVASKTPSPTPAEKTETEAKSLSPEKMEEPKTVASKTPSPAPGKEIGAESPVPKAEDKAASDTKSPSPEPEKLEAKSVSGYKTEVEEQKTNHFSAASKSPSPTLEKVEEKPTTDAKLLALNKLEEPKTELAASTSPTPENVGDLRSSVDAKSPSPAAIDKSSIDAKSPSPVLEEHQTGRSAVTSTPEKPEESKLTDAKSPSPVQENLEHLKTGELPLTSKSPSPTPEKEDDHRKLSSDVKSPSPVLTKSEELTNQGMDVVSKSPSTTSEKADDHVPSSDAKSFSPVLEKQELHATISKTPSPTPEKAEDHKLSSDVKSPSPVLGKSEELTTGQSAAATKSPSPTPEKAEELSSDVKSPSPVLGKPEDLKTVSKSSSPTPEKTEEQKLDVKSSSPVPGKTELHSTVASKTPSPAPEKEEDHKTSDVKSPSPILEKPEDLKTGESAAPTKSPSPTLQKTEDLKSAVDAKSPSPVLEKLELEQSADASKLSSPTMEETKSTDTKSPSPQLGKPDDLKAGESTTDKSPSPTQQKTEDLKSAVDAKSPSPVLEKLELQTEQSSVASKSSSPTMEKTEETKSADTKSPSPVLGKPVDLKAGESTAVKSPSPTPEEQKSVSDGKPPSPVLGKPEDLKAASEAKSSSPVLEKAEDLKAVSKSPSPIPEKVEDLRAASDTKSPSPVLGKTEDLNVVSKSPSPTPQKTEEQKPASDAKSPSPVLGKPEDLKAASKSPSPTPEKVEEQKSASDAKSPSPVLGKPEDLKTVSKPPSPTPQKTEEQKSASDAKSPSPVLGKPEDHEAASKSPSPTPQKAEEQKSASDAKSPSPVLEKPEDHKAASKSPSPTPQKTEEQKSASDAKSPSPVLEKPEDFKVSKSPSPTPEKTEELTSASGAKSPSPVLGKPDLKAVFKSPSPIPEKEDDLKAASDAKSPSPVLGKPEGLKAASKSPSPTPEKTEEQKLASDANSPSPVLGKPEDFKVSKSPSPTPEKTEELTSSSITKSPLPVLERLEELHTGQSTVASKSPSPTLEKTEERKSSESIVLEKVEELRAEQCTTASKSPSPLPEIVEQKASSGKLEESKVTSTSKSPSPFPEKIEEVKSLIDAKSPSPALEKLEEPTAAIQSPSPIAVEEIDSVVKSTQPALEAKSTEASKTPSPIPERNEEQRLSFDGSKVEVTSTAVEKSASPAQDKREASPMLKDSVTSTPTMIDEIKSTGSASPAAKSGATTPVPAQDTPTSKSPQLQKDIENGYTSEKDLKVETKVTDILTSAERFSSPEKGRKHSDTFDVAFESPKLAEALVSEKSVEEAKSSILKGLNEKKEESGFFSGLKASVVDSIGKISSEVSSVLKTEAKEASDDINNFTLGQDSKVVKQSAEIVEEVLEKGKELLKESGSEVLVSSTISALKKEFPRSTTPSDIGEFEGRSTPRSDISSGQVTSGWGPTRPDSQNYDTDEEIPSSPMSVASHIPSPQHFDYEKDSMTGSVYGALPDDFPQTADPMYTSMYVSKDDDLTLDKEMALKTTEPEKGESSKDPVAKWGKPLGLPPPPVFNSPQFTYWNPYKEWGEPLGLPSPAPPTREDTDVEVDTSGSAKTTPKKVAKMNAENNKLALNTNTGKEVNNKTKRSDSPVKRIQSKEGRRGGSNSIYLDLSYVPHHGNSHYANVEFFKRIRARYYVFSGTEPSKEVFNALLEAKQTWEDKDLEVTIIPTYDTDTLGYWIAENEETLSKYKIDLSPSASRCTINLQDHDTSCSAYRLEF